MGKRLAGVWGNGRYDGDDEDDESMQCHDGSVLSGNRRDPGRPKEIRLRLHGSGGS